MMSCFHILYTPLLGIINRSQRNISTISDKYFFFKLTRKSLSSTIVDLFIYIFPDMYKDDHEESLYHVVTMLGHIGHDYTRRSRPWPQDPICTSVWRHLITHMNFHLKFPFIIVKVNLFSLLGYRGKNMVLSK